MIPRKNQILLFQSLILGSFKKQKKELFIVDKSIHY